jgi:glycosyltransferase involved in cell wall biosynthesis
LRAQGIVSELRVAGGDWLHLRTASRWWCRGVPTRFDGDLTDDAMPAAYDWADVVALPSYTEAFGLVAQEALLAGRPVVASRVGGLTELLDDLPGALLTRVGDAVALADAMGAISGDRAGWRARAETSAERLVSERTPEAALDALDRAYAIALAHAVRKGGAR